MKIGTELTIHLNILAFIGGTGFVLLLRGEILIGSIMLLASGIYGNIFARHISKKIMKTLTNLLVLLKK
ncbi:MAG: hypothetical protein C0180_00820 [Aciduliprofundum sp.]|nr:hypothetical protein [Thermoplasmatales archaeon]PMP75652.1 MAG: hypothetical protein C0180_00820 [Aciduliprofundum sp.]